MNASASRWLAGIIEGWGLGDAHERADWIIRELLAQGVRPVESPPPLRGEGADPERQKAAKAEIDRAIAEARARRIAAEGHGGGPA